jgi:hypothetical protein
MLLCETLSWQDSVCLFNPYAQLYVFPQSQAYMYLFGWMYALYALNRHMKKHSDEREVCTQCHGKFKDIKSHMVSCKAKKTKIYQCDHCDKNFSEKRYALMTSFAPIAASCQELLKCGCRISCSGNCKCFRSELPCTALCSCNCSEFRSFAS